jgi:YidC/Oxa1 family membrane protein insertase
VTILQNAFGQMIDVFYGFTGNFGTAIIVFAAFTRVILFPLSLISQKNSIILFKIMPMLDDIKARHSGELSVMLKEQKSLYKREKYSSLKAILPLLVQIPVIIGVVRAVYAIADTGDYNFDFLGVNLSEQPPVVLIPILAAVSSFFMCLMQNSLNPLTKSQGFFGKWGTAIFLTAFSGYFAFSVQGGVGLFWIAGNIFSMAVTVIATLIYPPKKYIDFANYSPPTKPTAQEKREARAQKQSEKVREKADIERFYAAANKQVVFYSEGSGFYKYFKHYIEHILDNSDITIHYITSDLNDQVFDLELPRLESYFCGGNGLISLMMKLDCDVLVMTMPDLGKYHIKRSLVRKDIEYIYTDHGFGSVNLLLRKGALDNFDTVFCGGKSYNAEIRAMEQVYSLPEKRLIDAGFGLFDELIARVASLTSERAEKSTAAEKPQILIAPSWQKDNILEFCLEPLMEGLLCGDYKIIIRPHPEFVKRFPAKMRRIIDKYGDRTGDDFEIQTDFSSNSAVYLSDVVITDWSTIAQEFSFATKKPSLFINTPMKIMNPDWELLKVEPIDIWIRDEIGVSVDVDDLGAIRETVQKLIADSPSFSEKISGIFRYEVYNIGESAKVGGDYIIGQIERKSNGSQSES